MRIGILVILSWLCCTNVISQNISLDSLFEEINRLELDSNYYGAKKIITDYLPVVEEDKWFELSKELIYVNEKLGLFNENLSLFNEAHDKGFFYFIHPAMPSYNPYKKFDEFISISQQDLTLRAEANKKSKTIFETQFPDNYEANRKYPLIFLLHGGGKNINDVKKHWQVNELNNNYIKVYVQSYRHFDSQTYGWNSIDNKLINDFDQFYKNLIHNYAVDTSVIIMGSISAGANAAIELALKSIIPAKGLIAYCPGMPLFLKSQTAGSINNYRVKAYIVSGEDDHFITKQETLTNIFDSLNMEYKYRIVKGMGHQYPTSEEYFVHDGIKYITEKTQISSELNQSIKNRIKEGYTQGLSIGVIDTAGISYYNYGKAFNNSDVTPTENTIYEIGSVTKVFTTSLYSILLGLQILNENNEVGDYFLTSEISGAARKIRLVDLATHTSGLPVFPSNLNTKLPGNFTIGYSKKDFLEFLNNYEIKKNNCYSYSNTGISLLALVMEKATGKSYEELFNEYLSEEMGLLSTYSKVPEIEYGRFADGSSLCVKKSHWALPNVLVPDGGMKSTVKDLSRFIQANLQQINYKYQPSLVNTFEIKQRISDSVFSGIGWKITEEKNKIIIWHNGNTGGFASFIGFSPQENKGVVVLSNSNLNINDIGWKLLDENSHLIAVKRHICFKLNRAIQEQGLDFALEFYAHEMDKTNSNYVLGDTQLIESAKAFMSEDITVSNRIYEFALKKYPKSPGVYIGAAECLLTQGKYVKAMEILKNAKDICPENEQINNMIKQLNYENKM